MNLEEVLKCPKLPTLPTVAVKLLELTSDPDASMKDIASLVQQDQALAGRVLRTVNSSYYALSTPCGSIERAMGYLGLNTVKSLVLGFSLVEASKVEGEEFDMMNHWRRALMGASAARAIAQAVGGSDPDEAFTAGLFQDVGALACYATMDDAYSELLGDLPHKKWSEAEFETLGFTHMTVGKELAGAWKLPPAIGAAIAEHHTEDPDPGMIGHLAVAVCVGSIVSEALTVKNPASRIRRIDAILKKWYGKRAPNGDALLASVAESSETLSKLFDQDIGSVPDVSTLMAAAADQTLEHQIEMQRQAEAHAREAVTDGLTGLSNRKRFDVDLAGAFEQFQNDGTPCAILFSDADRFKLVNDTHGHSAGDAVLVELAKRATAVIGSRGTVYRFGGEEIAVVLPGMNVKDAATLGEALRHEIDRTPFDLSEIEGAPDSLNVTISVGVSATDAGDPLRLGSMSDLLREADDCVYAAKEAGRNKVVVQRRLRPEAEAAPEAAAAGPTNAGPGSRLRLLIIEDDPLASALLSTLMRRKGGIEIECLRSGRDASARFDQIAQGTHPRPDFVLCDLNLPEISGYQLLRQARQIPGAESMPIIVLSADEQPGAGEMCHELGATDFVRKEDFCNDMARWLDEIVKRGFASRQAA